MFGMIERPDIFELMRLIGIEKEDHLFCFDLINNARNEVLAARGVKS